LVLQFDISRSLTALKVKSKVHIVLNARFWAVKNANFSLFTFVFDNFFTSQVPKVFENHRFGGG